MKKILYSMVVLVVAAFIMTSCEDVPMPYDRPGTGGNGGETIVVEPAGSGTAEDPFNVAAAIAYVKTLKPDVDSDKEIYVKGVVVENKTTEETIKQYGNMTFTMADAGTKKPVFTAFQVYGLSKKKFKAVSDIQAGQEVVVRGKVMNFRGKTPETVGKGKAYVVSINGKGGSTGGETTPGDAKGDGTQAKPYNVAGIIAFTKALAPDQDSEKQVYFTGTVDSFKSGEEPGNTYGTTTFYLKDESTKEKFYCFRVKGPDNKKFTSAEQLKVGDKVVVYGNVVNYHGNTPETVFGKAYVVSVNGKGGSTGGGTSAEAKGDGSEANPYNVAGAVDYIQKLGKDVNSDKEVFVKGIVLENKTTAETITKYGNMTFTMVDAGTKKPVFTAFQVLGLSKKKFKAVSDIQAGQEVVVRGKVVNFKGNTPETIGKGASYVVSINGKGGSTGGGSTEPTKGFSINGTTVTITNAAVKAGTETMTCVVNDLGIADKSAVAGQYKLSDGSTFTIAQGEGMTAPTYYKVSKGFRIYANNKITFDCKKTIAKIEFICDSYNGINYVGNLTATIAFDGTKAIYHNKHVENKGGVQLRLQKIIITYAAK